MLALKRAQGDLGAFSVRQGGGEGERRAVTAKESDVDDAQDPGRVHIQIGESWRRRLRGEAMWVIRAGPVLDELRFASLDRPADDAQRTGQPGAGLISSRVLNPTLRITGMRYSSAPPFGIRCRRRNGPKAAKKSDQGCPRTTKPAQ
jgi:hypothetical protein